MQERRIKIVAGGVEAMALLNDSETAHLVWAALPISASASGVMARSMDVVLDGTFASNGTLDIVAKDLHLACQLARDVSAPSRIGDIVYDVLQRAQAQGWGKDGYPSVAKVLEKMAGAEVRSKSKK